MTQLNTKTSNQVIIAKTDSIEKISAKLYAFEKVDGVWREAFEPMDATIGKNGFAYDKVEGDNKSPLGIFTFGTSFGKESNPGTLLPYRQTTENDFWVDDPNSEYYNTWQEGPPNGRWQSSEVMRRSDNLYDYGIVINYNTSERTPGKGSAIFMHIWRGPGSGTAGCISTSEQNMLSIMRWINPEKEPIIMQGSALEVDKWMEEIIDIIAQN